MSLPDVDDEPRNGCPSIDGRMVRLCRPLILVLVRLHSRKMTLQSQRVKYIEATQKH